MKPKTETTTGSLAVVGVDIGKEVFHLVGLNTDGTIAFRRKIRRSSLKDVFEQLPPCVVGMEACMSAHFVSRTLRTLGHEPRINPGDLYQTLREGAEERSQRCRGGREAALRPNPRVVQEKSQNQLDLQACHRVRSRLVPDGRRRSTRSEPF